MRRGRPCSQQPVDAADVTAAIQFLLETPSITGQMIALDGGQHLGLENPGKRVSSGRQGLEAGHA